MKKKSPEIPLPPQPPQNQRKKKTRDLPNLSDCHCCNRRINHTNPKNRLKTLTSEWRVVLLCSSCHNLVESSQYCSYCLSTVSCSSMDSFSECKRCHRRVHRDCVSMFSFGPGNCGDFFVCFDCWVPKLLENDYARVCGSRTKKKVKTCGDLSSLGSSRVCDVHDKGKSLEEMANEANVEAQKKVAVAVEAKEKALLKAMVAKKAVELASGSLDLVAVDKGGSDQEGVVVEDDAQLAFQLHRAMNSSPRIARNFCLLNTDCLEVPAVRKSTNVGGDANSVDTDSLSCRELNRLCLVETRQDCAVKSERTQDVKCNGVSNGSLITYNRRGRESKDERCKKEPGNCLLRMYSRRLSRVRRHNAGREHCFKTYRRRPSPLSQCKNNLLYGGFNLDHGRTSAIALNCEEPRACANAT